MGTAIVTNESFALRRVDVAVDVDGHLVVDRLFTVGSQHNRQSVAAGRSGDARSLSAVR